MSGVRGNQECRRVISVRAWGILSVLLGCRGKSKIKLYFEHAKRFKAQDPSLRIGLSELALKRFRSHHFDSFMVDSPKIKRC